MFRSTSSHTDNKVTFHMQLAKYLQVIDNGDRWGGKKPFGAGCLLPRQQIPASTDRTFIPAFSIRIDSFGSGFDSGDSRHRRAGYRLRAGESFMYYVGGPDYPETIANAERVLARVR